MSGPSQRSMLPISALESKVALFDASGIRDDAGKYLLRGSTEPPSKRMLYARIRGEGGR